MSFSMLLFILLHYLVTVENTEKAHEHKYSF